MTGSSVSSSCNLPEDQSGTISGRWPVTPVPLAIRSGQFNQSETSAITTAVSSWNDYHNEAHGFTLMDIGGPELTDETQPESLCLNGLVSGDEFTGQVVIHKVSSGWSYGDDIVALTSFCPIAEEPYPRIYTAMMELNYENFFVDGQKKPDLESIMLHEFGHLIGLNHSCETFDKEGTPDCNDDNLPQDYFEAVMFPIILFPNNVNGEERRELKTNDQERANCLYGDTG